MYRRFPVRPILALLLALLAMSCGGDSPYSGNNGYDYVQAILDEPYKPCATRWRADQDWRTIKMGAGADTIFCAPQTTDGDWTIVRHPGCVPGKRKAWEFDPSPDGVTDIYQWSGNTIDFHWPQSIAAVIAIPRCTLPN